MYFFKSLRGVCILVSFFNLIGYANSGNDLNVLSLKEAISISVANHPKIKSKHLQLEAKKAEVRHVNRHINPELEFEWEDIGKDNDLTDIKSLESTISISQRVELGGKRQRRTKIKLDEVEILSNEIEILKLDIIKQTSDAFIYALASQEKHKLSQELESISRSILKIITNRVDSGKSALLDQERAEVHLLKQIANQEEALKELKIATFRLGTLLNKKIDSSLRLDEHYLRLPILKTIEHYEKKLEGSFIVNSFDLYEQLARTKLELEISNRLPDYHIGAGFRTNNATNDRSFLLNFSIDLPFFNRNQDQVMASHNKVQASEEWSKFEQLEISNLLHEKWESANAFKKKIDLLKNKILPKSESIAESIKKGYTEGKYDYIDLLEVNMSFIDSKEQYISHVLGYRLAMSQIDAITTSNFNSTKE